MSVRNIANVIFISLDAFSDYIYMIIENCINCIIFILAVNVNDLNYEMQTHNLIWCVLLPFNNNSWSLVNGILRCNPFGC